MRLSIKSGYSQATVRHNASVFIHEGKPRAQAIAIALAMARKAYFARYPQGALPLYLTPPDGKRMQNPVKPNPAASPAKVHAVADIPESPLKNFVMELLDAYKRGGMSAARKLAGEISQRHKFTMGENAALSNYFFMGKKEIDEGMDAALGRGRAKNPVPLSRRAKIEHAAQLYESFTGHEAGEIESIDKPVLHDVMLNIGKIDGVMYSTVRDGKPEKYIHKFKKSCRPTFAVSHDGKALYMLGGAYDFTERGIIDKT